jgi:hypothetical protein
MKGAALGARQGILDAYEDLKRGAKGGGAGGGFTNAAYHPDEGGAGSGLRGGGGFGGENGLGGKSSIGDKSAPSDAPAAPAIPHRTFGQFRQWLDDQKSGGITAYGGNPEATAKGAESVRRAIFGHPHLARGPASLTEVINQAAKAAGIDPRIMEGIRAGESHRNSKYDSKDDALESSWGPFQLNRKRGLGVAFEHDTGLDVRDPSTIPAQAKWVAQYIKKHHGTNGQWMGYRGPRDADPKWGESGYKPTAGRAYADVGKAAENIKTKTPLSLVGGVTGLHADYAHSILGGGLTSFEAGGKRVTTNKEAAPYFRGFIDELKKDGAPITSLGGYNDRNKVGAAGKSQHAFGNAVDIDQVGRNVVKPEFLAWLKEHPKELGAAERRWHMVGGEHFGGDAANLSRTLKGYRSRADLGHWEYGGPGDHQDTREAAASLHRKMFGHRGQHHEASAYPGLSGHGPGSHAMAASLVAHEHRINGGASSPSD